jgi:YHS domain-containing protein
MGRFRPLFRGIGTIECRSYTKYNGGMRIDIFIVLLVAAILLYRWYQKAPKENASPAKDEGSQGTSSTEMVQDPNCSTYVPETEAIKATIEGRDYNFCSEKCAEIYRKKRSAV